MKASSTPKIHNHTIIRALSKCPNMLNDFTDQQVIWYPEWKYFMIVKLNNIYFLFEKRKMLFHNTLLETVKSELIERFHFSELRRTKILKLIKLSFNNNK